MHSRKWLWSLLIGLSVAPSFGKCEESVDFDLQVRPILSDKCFQCHGPDEEARQAGLRLDTESGLKSKRDDGEVVVPGKPERSLLFQRVTHADAEQRMPPADAAQQLTKADILILKKWIAQGGKWGAHWAFRKPVRPALPKLKDSQRVNNAIDRFVLAKLEAMGRSPSPKASPEILLRRASFDLMGLPPTLEELDSFLTDTSPGAFARAVDRLLSSPRYGEHMARYWLDATRYADTNGYQYDTKRTQWPWRDWVINAYNTGKPFDQFTVEQLAGDLLPNATTQQVIATGMNRNHGITIEGGVIDEEYRTEYVVDRVVTTSTVWMGLTFLCARCHDHKYDPISQREFYQMFAFFNQVPERGNSGFAPRIKVKNQQLEAITSQLKQAESTLAKATERSLPAQEIWEKKQREDDTNRVSWTLPSLVKWTASSKAPLKKLPDGSLLAGGNPPGNEDYEIILEPSVDSIRSIRLQALTHDLLPHRGPGRAFNSNFVLSEFECEVASPGSDQFRKLDLKRALADYSQRNYEIAKAIDGNPGTGWAVDGPTKKEDRAAIFVLASNVNLPKGSRLKIRLKHRFGTAHAIGRVRLSVSPDIVESFGNQVFEALATARDKRSPQQQQLLLDLFLASKSAPPQLKQLNDRIARLNQTRQQLGSQAVDLMVMQEMPNKRKTHVLYRGQYDQKREVVKAGTPQALPPMGDRTGNRLGFAKWLVDAEHPLTARVAVNHIWHRFFGRGLVESMEDFGSQGARPSHPQLLDWLAVEFRESGWDVKRLQKLILTSATYQQSSRMAQGDLFDPTNTYLSRGPRSRLEAEMIRDSALYVSGLMDSTLGGPSVFPYHPKGLWLEINNRPGYSQKYEPSKGVCLYRRSMYTFWKRTVPPPSMQTFDAPEREFCVIRRSTTNTPLQAFVLLHDPQFVEAANHLAKRLLQTAEKDDTDESIVRRGFRMVTSRRPNAAELRIILSYLNSRRESYRDNSDAARRILRVGETSVPEADLVEQASWASVARLLFNLSEAITKS